jgi:hypothetical protein
MAMFFSVVGTVAYKNDSPRQTNKSSFGFLPQSHGGDDEARPLDAHSGAAVGKRKGEPQNEAIKKQALRAGFLSGHTMPVV